MSGRSGAVDEGGKVGGQSQAGGGDCDEPQRGGGERAGRQEDRA